MFDVKKRFEKLAERKESLNKKSDTESIDIDNLNEDLRRSLKGMNEPIRGIKKTQNEYLTKPNIDKLDKILPENIQENTPTEEKVEESKQKSTDEQNETSPIEEKQIENEVIKNKEKNTVVNPLSNNTDEITSEQLDDVEYNLRESLDELVKQNELQTKNETSQKAENKNLDQTSQPKFENWTPTEEAKTEKQESPKKNSDSEYTMPRAWQQQQKRQKT